MEEYSKYIGSIIDNYFTILNNKGQISNCKTNKLLVLLFIKDLFDVFYWYITDKDYDTILNAINCLTDCLVNLPSHKHFEDNLMYIEHYDDVTRITENSLIRITEDNIVKEIE